MILNNKYHKFSKSVLTLVCVTLFGCATNSLPPKSDVVFTLPSGQWVVIDNGNRRYKARHAYATYYGALHAKEIGCKRFMRGQAPINRNEVAFKCGDSDDYGLYTEDVLSRGLSK